MNGFNEERFEENDEDGTYHMDEMDCSGFTSILTVNSIFIRGQLMPLEIFMNGDEDAWEKLETRIARFCRKAPGVRVVGQSQMLALN